MGLPGSLRSATTQPIHLHFVPEFKRLVRQHGTLRVLFDMTTFHGWEAGAIWEDIKFATKHFEDIERLAMIGEKKWQHGMATLCKPFKKAAVRYFERALRAAYSQLRWLFFEPDVEK